MNPQTRPEVLCVDDDAMVLSMLDAVLTSLGYQVIAMECPLKALAYVKGGNRIDLLITDLHMPTMHGLDLADCIQTLRPNLPVILITGFCESETCRMRAPGRSLLLKPFDLNVLKEMISRMLLPS